MKKYDFNNHWTVAPLRTSEAGSEAVKNVTLPHDAMRTEIRTEEALGVHNIGWYDAKDYRYVKHFTLTEDMPREKLVLEFEGVYKDAEITVNGNKMPGRAYGYTDFYVDITDVVNESEENTIEVIAHNADQPNSRWYTGTGIYRPVWLYAGEKKHIPVNGVRVYTKELLEDGSAVISVDVDAVTSEVGRLQLVVTEPNGEVVAEKFCDAEGRVKTEITIPDAKLWSTETPRLYQVRAVFEGDEVCEYFGIRTLAWDDEKGISINGERVILKGACIHHDNGVLGACAFPEAEERKIRILKNTGYNAIRSAHNPCSKAMLEACDRLGMLVMDEYTDMWYIHKNKYDYATKMQDNWRSDLREMVDKDFNHPCVVLYSTGNEVAETGQEKGIQLTKDMTEYLHSMDATRPVTCGINIFFNALYAMGFGVYSDDKAEKEAQGAENNKSKAKKKDKKKTVGSEFYNTLAGLLGDKTMKLGATLPICDRKTRGAYANMDVAGYNYGIERYEHDLKKYPHRLILGSETFCRDAYRFYELAKKNPRIVGDFVWAGMDYIGEAGIGAWEYEDYAPRSGSKSGWLTAGSGRINILGFAGGEAQYTKVALEKEQGPLMAVKPVYQKGKHSPSAWKMTDAMRSWSWPGCEGQKAKVEVYARAAEVKLFLNHQCVGEKKLKNGCVAYFTVPYEPGILTAVSYDAVGNEIGRCKLRSAKEETKLSLIPEKKRVAGNGLAFVRLRYTDDHGTWKPMEKHRISIQVENGKLEGFGNACAYNEDGYDKTEISTYYGEALAVVRAGSEGVVRVTVRDEEREYSVEIPVIKEA